MGLLFYVQSVLIFLERNAIRIVVGFGLLGTVSTIRFAISYAKARAQFPGPPVKNFWIGNLNDTMSDEVHKKWLQWNREHGNIFQTWNGLFGRVIYIGNPQIIDEIATANWQKSAEQYDGFRPLSGDALFIQMNHDRWKSQKKRLAPAFSPQVIDSQYFCLTKHLTNFIAVLETGAKDNTTLDFASLHILLSLDIIGDLAYGAELRAISQGPDCRILQLFEMVLPEMMKCGLFPLRAKFPVMKKTRDMFRAIAELRGMADKAVEHARGDDKVSKEPLRGTRSRKIFEILAEQREPDGDYTFSAKELRDNYVAFLVAGGDPTAHAMSFFIYEVLRHPDIYTKLRAELDATIPYDAFIPSLDEVKSLSYLNMVLKETLRYHSTGFGTFRTCPVDTEVAGITLPANTTLALWNYAVHRDPTLWEDPDTFDPERWRRGDTKVRGSYFPFSWGPRRCTGEGLAMLEMTMTLATVFRRYDLFLKTGFEMELLASFTLRPKNGLPVRVVRRTS